MGQQAKIVVRGVGLAFGCEADVMVRGRRVHTTRTCPHGHTAYRLAATWATEHGYTVPASIRLSDLTPTAVADEVSGWVISHLIQCRAPRVRHAVATLTHYAQHGGELDARPADYVQTVVEALYTAAHPDVYSSVEGDWQRASEPAHAIDVVIRAALARAQLDAARGKIPVQCLAALGGVSIQTLRAYGSRGAVDTQIQIEDGDVRVPEARRWLEARGVPGIGRRKTTK